MATHLGSLSQKEAFDMGSISTFVFSQGSEVLSRLIIKEEQKENIRGITLSKDGPSIWHLLFVDVLMLFNRANHRDANATQEALNIYENWSGQRINRNKLSAFSVKISDDWGRFLFHFFLNNLDNSPSKSKYLALPVNLHR